MHAKTNTKTINNNTFVDFIFFCSNQGLMDYFYKMWGMYGINLVIR